MSIKITQVELIEPGLVKLWGDVDGNRMVSQPWVYTKPRVSTSCDQCQAFLEKGRIAYRPLGKSAKSKLCVMCVEQPPAGESGER